MPGVLVAIINPQILQIFCLLRGILEPSKKNDVVLNSLLASSLV